MKKLYCVTVSEEVEVDGYVWAESKHEAEQIAESDFDLSDSLGDGLRVSQGFEVTADELSKYGDQAECTYGDPPDDADPIRTVGDALKWLGRDKKRAEAWEAFKKTQIPLFPGVDPVPIKCEFCGNRWPMEAHRKDCVEGKDGTAKPK